VNDIILQPGGARYAFTFVKRRGLTGSDVGFRLVLPTAIFAAALKNSRAKNYPVLNNAVYPKPIFW